MRKKLFVFVMTAAMLVGVCACKKKAPDGTLPTPEAGTTGTPAATTPGASEVTPIPITNYEECLATTILPENYMGLEVEKITEEEIQDYINEILEDNIGTEEVDRAVQEGDVVDVDYAGYLDGVAFDGGTGNNPSLEIGSHSFIDGFEDGLIGMKKGESKSLPLKFPDEYKNNPDLAGKDVIFEVTVNSVSVWRLPDFTDEFVDELTSGMYKTTEELRQYATDTLSENKAYKAIMDYLLENTTFGTINEDLVKDNVQALKDYYEMYANMYGIDLDTFLLWYGVPDAETFWKDMEEEFRNEEKERIVLYCVAKKEGITYTDKEFDDRVAELAEQNDQTVEEFLELQDRRYLEQSLLMEKAFELLMENVVVVEK